jgi:hypothetical protein
MSPEKTKLLVEKYPKIFKLITDPPKDGPHLPISLFIFEHSDGWYNIIDKLCACIQHHIDWRQSQRESLLQNNPHNVSIPDEIQQVVAVQIKEKFGTLRFYYDGGDEYIRGLVSMAEVISEITCETCGAPGKLRPGGWIRTLCDTHAIDN